MKIAVVGAGAMGSVYAGLLAAAGNEVWAIDTWKEHIDAIRAGGLRVEGASGDRTVRLDATTNASEPGPCDLVIIATKADGVASAAASIGPLLHADTLVLTIQNGLGAAETDLPAPASGQRAARRRGRLRRFHPRARARASQRHGARPARRARGRNHRAAGADRRRLARRRLQRQVLRGHQPARVGKVRLQRHLQRFLHDLRMHHRRRAGQRACLEGREHLRGGSLRGRRRERG